MSHDIVGLFLVSISVGLSNFAGSIGIGLSGVDGRTRLRVGIAFGLFEGLMPIVGLFIGQALAGTLGHWGRYIGAGLLVLTGAYTIWQGRRTGAVERKEEEGSLETRQLVILAVALSLDNLVVGFALGVYHISIVLAAVTMAVVSVGRSNHFGHPVPEVLERYDAIHAVVFRTDQDGAVGVDTDGRTIRMRAFTGRSSP